MNIYEVSPEVVKSQSKVPFRVMEKEQDMYEEIAQIMFDTIKANGDEKTVIICPVGPIFHYPVFVEKVNSARLSLKNCYFINMDEYLTENDEYIPYDSILSFRQIMDNMLYSKIDPELVMPPEQRIFPCPGKEAELDALIEKLGKVDLVLTGVGINGHVAFNEPPLKTENITDEDYRNIGTRCLDISPETIVNNGANKICGALDVFPKRCITIGMKQLLKAKTFKVYLYCKWQWGIMRKTALGEQTRFSPVSFLQSHPNAEMVVTKELYEHKVF